MKQKSSVWIFMLVAYGFSWLFWIPDALIAQGIWNAPEGVKNFLVGPFNFGPWGPLFAAIAVTLKASQVRNSSITITIPYCLV